MKLLVKTTGKFMLLDPMTNCEMESVRPSVVQSSQFVNSRIAVGQIEVIAGHLKEEATDAEFANFWKGSNGDEALAVESFLSAFKKGPVTEEELIALEAPEPQPDPEPAKPVRIKKAAK